MTAVDHSWKIIYPAMLNANRTEAQGRRIGKERCVADPKWQEIKDVLEATSGFVVQAEPHKVYPREMDKESPAARGRIKYQCTNSKYTNKKQVLVFLGETIPKLKSRAKAGNATGGAEQTQASGGGGGQGKSKKGRRK